jgi:thioredoxin-related protein
MKKVLFGVFSVVGVALAMYTFSPIKKGVQASQSTGKAVAIKWMSWQEAVEANKKEQKKIFIDCYTDWCGWCKKMDRDTYANPDIIKKLNKDFIVVKFNPELSNLTYMVDSQEYSARDFFSCDIDRFLLLIKELKLNLIIYTFV